MIMCLQQTVTEANEAFQKQFNHGEIPIVDVVAGLSACHSPRERVKCTPLQGEDASLMRRPNTDAD